MGEADAEEQNHEMEETRHESAEENYESEVDSEQEYHDENEEDVDSVESSPDREVYMKQSRSQRRNKRRRRKEKLKREQANTPVKERLDANHPKMRKLRQGKGATRNPHTPSTEIPSEEEQDDAQDTKVPKTSARNQRK